MGSNLTKPNASLVTDLGNNPAVQAAIAGILSQLLSALPGLVIGLFNRKPKPVVAPGEPPVPNPNHDAGPLDDDVIPDPVSPKTRTIKEVRIVTDDLQYSRKLNSEKYTPDNPNGMYENPRSYEGGVNAVNIGTKGWFDLTAFDQDGNEFKPEAVAEYGLAYDTEHHIGDAFIKGNGGSMGNPKEGYETQDGQVGNGISAWKHSNGFKHQVKFHGEGTWEVFGKVGGVESKHFIIRVD